MSGYYFFLLYLQLERILFTIQYFFLSETESLYIYRRLVFRTFTDKSGITNPLDVVLKTLSSEAGVTNIEITLFTVVFRVLINHVGIVVFVLSYLRAAREGSVVLSEEDLGHTGNIGD